MTPMTCDKNTFQMIYSDLAHFGEKGHERLTIAQTDKGRIPKTAKEEFWLIRILKAIPHMFLKDRSDEMNSTFIVEFFENNKQHVQTNPTVLLRFEKLTEWNEPLRKRYEGLVEEVFHDKVVQDTKDECDRIIKDKEENVRSLDERIQTETQRLAFLQDKIEASADTLIRCADGEILTHFALLKGIRYFKDQPRSAPQADNPALTHSFDLSSYSAKEIQLFLEYLEKPDSLQHLTDKNALLALYRLSIETRNPNFENASLHRLVKILSPEDCLQILSSPPDQLTKPLIHAACDKIAFTWDHIKSNPKFADIRHEYLIEILKRNDIHTESERALFHDVVKWAEATSKKRDKTPQAILYEIVEGERLIDQIRFEHFTHEEFLQHVYDSKLLDAKEHSEWSQFFLYDKEIPVDERPFRPLSIVVEAVNDQKVAGVWRVPAKVIENHTLALRSTTINLGGHFFFLECQPFGNDHLEIIARPVKGTSRFNYRVTFENPIPNEGILRRRNIFKRSDLEKNINQFTNFLEIKFEIFTA